MHGAASARRGVKCVGLLWKGLERRVLAYVDRCVCAPASHLRSDSETLRRGLTDCGVEGGKTLRCLVCPSGREYGDRSG